MFWSVSSNLHPQFWDPNETPEIKVGIITIGTWYKALWSPNLIQNHNKKVFHTSFEIHLFLGNVPPLQCITELPDDSNSQKKDKYYFFWPKLDQNVQLYQKMVEHHHFPISFKFSNPGAYITYLMLLYLPWFDSPKKIIKSALKWHFL